MERQGEGEREILYLLIIDHHHYCGLGFVVYL